MYCLIKKIYRRFLYYTGPFKTWNEAKKLSHGYHHKEIFNKTKKAAIEILKKNYGYERDSVIFYDNNYNKYLVSKINSLKKKTVNILDYGGSLGSIYFQNKKKINKKIVWSIIDLKKIIQEGKKNFESRDLKFFFSLENYQKKILPDILILSSSLQYLKNYNAILSRLVSLRPKYIFILKTPFSEKKQNQIFIQKIPKNIYNSSCPFWRLDLGALFKLLSNKYKLLKITKVKPEVFGIQYLDLAFKKK
jgi:putative methyltransferase (TIGR04325 family)